MRCTHRPPVAPLSLSDGNWHVPRRLNGHPDPTKGLEGTCDAKVVKKGIRLIRPQTSTNIFRKLHILETH